MARQLTIPGLEAQMGKTLSSKATRDAIKVQDNRVALLEALYERDGRGDEAHPQHHTYTGLVEAFRYELGERVLQMATDPKRWGSDDWGRWTCVENLALAWLFPLGKCQ